ncbi:MAG: AMP-binding protein, partial [Calditerrivibrio sp.]|nr:AMP-binding protein [Calditerrivibrio sp.]
MTLLHYFYEQYKNKKNKIAFREKDLGIWKEYKWGDYFERVTKVAIYFNNLGIQKGDTIAIIGDNKPEWVIAELAAQLLGAYPIGIYQDSIANEVEYIINKAETKIVVAEDQEQVDKIIDQKEKFPQIVKVIYYDDKGMYQYNDSLLIFFEDIYDKIDNNDLEDFFQKRLSLLSDNDVAV